MKGIWDKVSLFSKKKGYECPVEDLEYPKGLVLELEYKDDPVNRIYSIPLLTDYGSEGGFKDRNRVIIL